jgi:DNA-directed RNA polymerase specialized sigma24 family protein
MNNQQLNNLVLDYRNNRNEETFERIYAKVSQTWKGLDTVGKSVKASGSEILAAYQDTLMNCIEIYDGRADFTHLLNRSIRFKRSDIYRKKKRLSEFEYYIGENENDDGSTAATYELADEFNLEDYVLKKKRADQRKLIDHLLNGADAKTTAIVEAFLASEKPTPTAIGEALGLHHSTVIRTLKRLAGKFDSKQFGNHRDYLVAL